MDCGKKMKAGGKVPPAFAAKKAAPAKGGKPNPFAAKKAAPFGKKEQAFAKGGTVRGMGAATKGGKIGGGC